MPSTEDYVEQRRQERERDGLKACVLPENPIDKLLEERGKVHGDPETTHSIALKIYETLCHPSNKMTDGQKGMLFLICVKLSRGAQHPEHGDHWDDIGGYAELIKRTVR